MSDLQSRDSSTWTRVKFYVTGFWACLWAGQLGSYGYYCAQAFQESRSLKSAYMLEKLRNPFGMHFPTVRKTWAIGKDEVAGEGSLAVYSSLLDAWKDRIYWSRVNNCAGYYDSCLGWANAQQQAGYNGSANYGAAVAQHYDGLNWFVRMWSNSTWLSKLIHGYIPGLLTVIQWAFALGVVALFVWIFYKVYKLFK